MSWDHDDDSKRRPFDVRQLNLTKIALPIDLQIVVAEADFAIAGIQKQIKDQYGDRHWQADAERAIGEISHKRGLALNKMAALAISSAARAEATKGSPESTFNKRFMLAAKELLPDTTYSVLFEAAGKARQ